MLPRLVLSLIILAGVARSAPIEGVIVDSVRYDAAKDATFITLANIAHKDVTAVTVNAYIGNQRLELTREFAGSADLFHQGTTSDLHIWGEKRPVTAAVIAVVYADGTNEAAIPGALTTIRQHRESVALAYDRANAVLATTHDAAAAAKQLEAEAAATDREATPPVASPAMLRELARQIRNSNDLVALSQANSAKETEWRAQAHAAEGSQP
jgi:hypothetical protein